jgi:UDPglucose--hexose-1-phosphate uridylyltransferase
VSEFRQDAITGRWTIVASGRGARPNEYAHIAHPSTPSDCPFCEGHESRTPEEVAAYRPKGSSANGPGWSVRTIPNKFPTVAMEASAAETPTRSGESRRPGTGRHEVVIESPSHSEFLGDLPVGQVREVLRMVRERVRALGSEPGIRSMVAFENCGPDSGGTLFHPHAQVVSLPDVPPSLADELSGIARHGHRHGGVCAFEAELAREREAAVRLIVDTPKVVVYAPFASAHPYEARCLPVHHAPSIGEAPEADVDRLAEILPRLLRSLRSRLPGVSFNWVSRGVPVASAEAKAYHWHLDLVPRAIRPDGFEIGTGTPVNPVPPEIAAEELREAFARRGPTGAGAPTSEL